MKRAHGEDYSRIRNLVSRQGLHTVCSSGNCPNIGECWSKGTATFMILGNICTRHCRFCAVQAGQPLPPDPGEPARLAEAIRTMNLSHCVITSVDRDDLDDLGVSAWTETIRQVRKINPLTTMEVLIPDFQGNKSLIRRILDLKPEIVSHNLETVERLTSRIRSKANYRTSLEVIRQVSSSGIISKSGIMVGLGETADEVCRTMSDLLDAGTRIMTLGQYLQPTLAHMPVREYITPEQFERYRETAISMGFRCVESGPLVRSSYRSEEQFNWFRQSLS